MGEEKTVFEKIVTGELPCAKIYEDEETFVFLDINPNSIGHSLVITKKPYKTIYELPNDIAGKLMQTVTKISKAIKKSLNCDGINIIMNNEQVAGQVVHHAHVHVIPRKIGDRGLHNHISYKDWEMKETAKKIALAIE